jgi:hypothetical protein
MSNLNRWLVTAAVLTAFNGAVVETSFADSKDKEKPVATTPKKNCIDDQDLVACMNMIRYQAHIVEKQAHAPDIQPIPKDRRPTKIDKRYSDCAFRKPSPDRGVNVDASSATPAGPSDAECLAHAHKTASKKKS